jgi:prevent-host-death family protein
MKISRDIKTVSDLKQNASKLVKQVKMTRNPVVLTLNGRPAAVIQDVESYEKMASAADYELTVRALREALEYVDSGAELIPAEEVFEKLSEKTGLKFDAKPAKK